MLEPTSTQTVIKLTAWVTFVIGCSVAWRFYVVSGFYSVFDVGAAEMGLSFQSARFITSMTTLLINLGVTGIVAYASGAIMRASADGFTDLVMKRACGAPVEHETRAVVGSLTLLAVMLLWTIFAEPAVAAPFGGSGNGLTFAAFFGSFAGLIVTGLRLRSGKGPVARSFLRRASSLRTLAVVSTCGVLLAFVTHAAAVSAAELWRYDVDQAISSFRATDLTLQKYGYAAVAGSSDAELPFTFARVDAIGEDFNRICEMEGDAFYLKAATNDGNKS